MFYVYKITNMRNGKIYIGKTNNIARRWAKHLSTAKIKNPDDYSYIHKSINKWGAENFSIEIIAEYLTEEESLQAEIDFIVEYESTNRNIGYNIATGGNTPMSGRKHTSETIEKLRLIATGKIPSAETRKKMSEAHIGSKRTEATKQKMRDARALQAPASQETKDKIAASKKGKQLSVEHKLKISENHGSRKLTDQDILAIIDLINQSQLSQKEIADTFSIDPSIVSCIKRGTKWKQFHHLIKR